MNLVTKVRASGYAPNRVSPKPQPAKFSTKQNLTTADTKKGQSRALVSRDGSPVNYTPMGAPRKRDLADIARSIR